MPLAPTASCNASTPVVTLGLTPKSGTRYAVLPGDSAESPLCTPVTLRTKTYICTRVEVWFSSARATLLKIKRYSVTTPTIRAVLPDIRAFQVVTLDLDHALHKRYKQAGGSHLSHLSP